MQTVRGRVADFRKWQNPRYLIAPDFSIPPPPDGPYALGTFVEDTVYCDVLNKGSARIPIPESDVYSDVKQDVEASVTSSNTYEMQTLAKFLDRSIGGNANLKGHKADNDTFEFQKIETTYFHPTRDYVQMCRALPDIEVYFQVTNYTKPIYLITGLKIAWGATYSSIDSQEDAIGGEAAVALGTEELNVQVKGGGRLAKASGSKNKVNSPCNFVLGIRLLKFFHRKKYYIFGEMVPCEKQETANAVFLDASGGAHDEDDVLVPEELDDEEAVKMVL